MCTTPVAARTFGIALLLLAGFLFNISQLQARPAGKFSYLGRLDALNNDTVLVSDTMVALSEKVRAFTDDLVDTISDTPSIFFIIDNSTSMSGVNGVDVAGNRFTVTSAFIDTIVSRIPQAEVGVAVFSVGLYYNPASKPGVFQTVLSSTRMGRDSTGAFVPLLTLNQTYGTQTGYDVLKEVLTVNAGALTYPTILTSQGGTNINSGFDAALQAFAASKVAKKNQFIIFLSDGEANQPATGTITAFTAATNCPATFTIYFTKSASIPTTIQTYTNNCKVNNYSDSDSLSQAWAYNNTSFEALMQFLMENIFSKIIKSHPAEPASIVINGKTASLWNKTDSTFTFQSLFPLTGLITPFSTVLSKSQGITNPSVFSVKTQPGAQLPRTAWEVLKWDRDIVFQTTGGTTVTTIARTMDSLQLRFDFSPGDASYLYSNVEIDLFNTNAIIHDRERVLCKKGAGNFFTGVIKRSVAAIATTSNGIIEHAPLDTLIAVFRNTESPQLPLDTLRISAVLSINARIVTAATKDNNGNGFIDAINLTFDNDTNITATSMPTNFSVQFGAATLTVTSIEKINKQQYRLLIKEPAGADLATAALQTSWTPAVTTTALDHIDDMTVTCVDSCAPVIYRVIKKIVDELDHTTDTVRVLFSEKIANRGGAAFLISQAPAAVLRVWWGADGDVNADSLLLGIPSFFNMLNDSILYFTMSNKKNLTDANWVNIKAADSLLGDRLGNLPSLNNRRVQVEMDRAIINARIARAATKDTSGNGYIDAINLTFDKPPLLSPATGPANFSLTYGTARLTVTGIANINPNQYKLLIQEPSPGEVPPPPLQTSWTPTLVTSAMKDNIDNMTVVCIDSCAPVIYRVIKIVWDANNRLRDTVKVMFSEKIKGQSGGSFAITNQPPDIFNVWWGNSSVSADTLLDGINSFTDMVNDSILYFTMKNNKDLSFEHWMNIVHSPVVIRDNIGNTPQSNNRKVQVEIQNISIIRIFPNPAVATKIQIVDGKDLAVEVVPPGEKSKAKKIVLEDKKGGAIIAIEGITLPPPNTGKVSLMMKIHDVAGNPVSSLTEDDLFRTSSLPGTSIYLYWNGFNTKGMRVAPGVYRAVVYVDYPAASNVKDLRTIAKLGITQ